MRTARLTNNNSVQYIDEIIASGTTKDVYLTEDKQSVLLLYKKPEYQRARINIDRLRSISTQFNLTISKDKGGAAKDENEALRMRQIFVWSAGMTITPGLGYLSPIFPDRFWFMNDP
ncbi:MAG: hypothetical protein HOG05_08345, partial [Bacteroidetes bacterium]|nr:hypothetical protein [Bacteroidota bacterium]